MRCLPLVLLAACTAPVEPAAPPCPEHPALQAIPLFYLDIDRDGLGGESDAIAACEQPPGTILLGGDCDDRDRSVPGPERLCNDIDDDCDGFDSCPLEQALLDELTSVAWNFTRSVQPGFTEAIWAGSLAALSSEDPCIAVEDAPVDDLALLCGPGEDCSAEATRFEGICPDADELATGVATVGQAQRHEELLLGERSQLQATGFHWATPGAARLAIDGELETIWQFDGLSETGWARLDASLDGTELRFRLPWWVEADFESYASRSWTDAGVAVRSGWSRGSVTEERGLVHWDVSWATCHAEPDRGETVLELERLGSRAVLRWDANERCPLDANGEPNCVTCDGCAILLVDGEDLGTWCPIGAPRAPAP